MYTLVSNRQTVINIFALDTTNLMQECHYFVPSCCIIFNPSRASVWRFSRYLGLLASMNTFSWSTGGAGVLSSSSSFRTTGSRKKERISLNELKALCYSNSSYGGQISRIRAFRCQPGTLKYRKVCGVITYEIHRHPHWNHLSKHTVSSWLLMRDECFLCVFHICTYFILILS